MFQFINHLKDEQELQEMVIARIEAGNEPPPRKTVYVKEDERLMKLVKKFNEDIHDGSFLPYLKAIAHNTRFSCEMKK